MWIFDKLIELADGVLEQLKPAEEVEVKLERPTHFPAGFLFVSGGETNDGPDDDDDEPGQFYLGQVSDIAISFTRENPCREIADIVDDSITDRELTSGEYSRKVLDGVKNPYTGFRLVSKDGLWYIFKRPSGMFWGEPQYEVYHRTKGAFMNRHYLVEVGEFHGCAYKTRDSALADINGIVENGLDNFFFDDVEDF